MKILHVQGDTGISGGIANYVSALVKNALPGQAFVVTGSERNPAVFDAMFPGAASAWIPFTYSMSEARAYRRILKDVILSAQPDVIHTHALRTAMQVSKIANRLNVPVVYTNHGLRYRQKTGRLDRIIFACMEYLVMQRVARTVCIREHDLHIARHMMHGDHHRLALVETRLAVPERMRSENVGTPLSIVGCGSLIPVKGPGRFLDWVEELCAAGRDVVATWLGDGELRATMERDIAARRLPVTLQGHVDKYTLFDVLAKADVMFLSSEFETFPLAVIEGYAMGVPVVSSSFEGVDDFVEHGHSGAILGRRGTETVIAAVDMLLGGEKAPETRRFCRERFQSHHADPARMAKSYARLYDEAIHGKR